MKPESPEPDTITVQVKQDGRLMIDQEPSNCDALGTGLFDTFTDKELFNPHGPLLSGGRLDDSHDGNFIANVTF